MDDSVLRKLTSFVLESGAAFEGPGGGFYLKAREKDSERFEVVKPYAFSEKDAPDTLSKRMYLEAISEAEGRGPGTHVFQIHAAEQGQRSSLRRMTFRHFVDEDDIGALVHEEPTERGLTSQLMRHMEAKERNFQSALSTLVSGFEVNMRLMSDRLTAHEKAEIERFILLKNLVERNEEREQKIQLIHEREARVTSFIDKLFALAPAVMEGLGILPEGLKTMLLESGGSDAEAKTAFAKLAPLLKSIAEEDPEARALLEKLVPKLTRKLSGRDEDAA